MKTEGSALEALAFQEECLGILVTIAKLTGMLTAVLLSVKNYR
jgi:hypothetical protein